MTIATSLTIPSFARAEHCLPDYIARRMDAHHITRIEKLLGGQHPHAWQPIPAHAIFLAGNDYLSIAAEPALVAAQVASLQAHAGGMLMSAVYLQEGSDQHRLESRLACFMGCEDGILAQSGMAANVGLIQCIAGPGIPVYLDMQAHASLWEGVLSAQAQAVAFLHNDMTHLRRQVAKHGRGVIVVDALYSTNGSLAPLLELLDIAERSDCVVVVDESHSLGTHGPQGAGLVEAWGLGHRVHFRTASLAKAFAGRAGFISCSSRFKGYFLSESRPAIFSSCLLAHELAWLGAALDFIMAADGRRATLQRHTLQVREGLRELGYNVSDGTEQIVALEAGGEPATLALRQALERHGIYGAMFCAPATAKNRAIVRLTLNAGLREDECARVLAACAAIRDETCMEHWQSTRRLRKLALV